MKKTYASPRMEVVELQKENMILTSGVCRADGPICKAINLPCQDHPLECIGNIKE